MSTSNNNAHAHPNGTKSNGNGNGSKNGNGKKLEQKKRAVKRKAVVRDGSPKMCGQRRKLKQQGKLNGKAQYTHDKLSQIVGTAMAPQMVQKVMVRAELIPEQVQWALTGLASYIINRGLLDNPRATSIALPYQAVYDGLTYLLQSILIMAIGGVQQVTSVPRVIGELIQALQAKNVKYHQYSEINFAWNQVDPSAYTLGPIHVGPGVWSPTYLISPDSGAYDETAPVFVPTGSVDVYTELLRMLSDMEQGKKCMEIISTDSKTVLEQDASTFAKVYRYNGLTAGTPATIEGGYYKDVELEVPITAPALSNFARYVTPDIRVPQKLAVYSGDAQSNLGLQFLSTPSSYFNKCTPAYKIIDFNEIYTMLCLWMCKMKEQLGINAAPSLVGSYTDELTDTLPFTAQDFRIALANALLAVFNNQCFNQAIGPTQSGGDNAFVPFMVLGHRYAAQPFQQLRVPLLLQENLAALKGRKLKINNKVSDINCPFVQSVIGYFPNDEPATFTFKKGSANIPLFASTVQEEIRLQDGFISGDSPRYVNCVGTYYQNVVADWNDQVTGLSSVSTATVPINGDEGASGFGVLWLTRVEEAVDPEALKEQKKRGIRPPISIRHVINSPFRDPPVDKKGNTIPHAIPDASITLMSATNVTSMIPLAAELQVLADTVILPVVRLNDAGDVLTLPMYQLEVGEGSLIPYTNVTGPGTGMYSKMSTYAAICVSGLAKEQNNTYSTIFTHLQELGKGGFLSSMLGGIAKGIFPDAAGIIDTIAAVVPI